MDITVLLVDDETPVRQTFGEWLKGADLGVAVLAAADAEQALQIANQTPIDLAILDWNLGAGDDGLQLLGDLAVFHPDIVAILVTGFANQATPLDAMRMGVRDYLDKNHDLNRETFLKAVRKQLDHIRPAKQVRQLHQSLVAFREAVEKILPLVQSTAALNDPVPLPEAIHRLVRLAQQATGARDGVLLVRRYDAQRVPAEVCRAYGSDGAALDAALVPFANSLAGSVVSRQEVCAIGDWQDAEGLLQPQAYEKGRRSLLAAPMNVAPGVQAVLELFDKDGGPFTPEDQRLAQAAADVGAELLAQALGHKHQNQLLLDAVAAALKASEALAAPARTAAAPEQPPPAQVLEQLRQGLRSAGGDAASADLSLQLAEAIRVLGLKHGEPALRHCALLIEQVRTLLDQVTGT
jgi:ActR/RegA family two-component response regulator